MLIIIECIIMFWRRPSNQMFIEARNMIAIVLDLGNLNIL